MMKFIEKIMQFFRSLFSKKTDKSITEKDNSKPNESEEKVLEDSKFKAIVLKVWHLLYKFLKKFIIFILESVISIMQPMIKISKKHPIAFWVAVILHLSILFALLYTNVDRWNAPQINSATANIAPIETVMLDYEIVDAAVVRIKEEEKQKQKRLKNEEKQKEQKLKNEEKRSETAKQDQKIAEQEALKAKAKKIMAEVQRKSEEAKTKEAEILASKANEIIADAETKTKIEEAKANEIIADAETKTKIEEAKAKKAEVKRIAEEAKTKEAEILVKEAAKKIEIAEEIRKQEEVKTKLAEIKRKVEEAKTQEAEILAKEATAAVKEAEEKRKAEEAKAKDAAKEFEESEAKRIAEELKLKLVEAKRIAVEIEIKKAKVKQSALEAETKEAELLVEEAFQQLEEDKQKKDLFELEIAELKSEQEKIQYNRMLAQAIQDEQDTTRSIIIEDQLNRMKSSYVIQIASKVKTLWRYQAAEEDWSAEVYVVQDKEGNVKAVDVRNVNVGDSSLGKSFMDSIERAVYKSSPLPAAPDEAVFDKELYFIFSVN
jgi:colicin import membrane protein